MEIGPLVFLDGMDGRREPCVHVVDNDRKYVATFYGHSLKNGLNLRDILVDCLSHLVVQQWVNDHAEEVGLREVCGQHQQAATDKPASDVA